MIDPMIDGIALAATIAGDRAAHAARAGLAEDLVRALDARLAEIAGDREPALRAITAALRPAIDPSAPLPPRAAALLATEVPREIGASWLARAPLPRAGFRASGSLRAQLRALGRTEQEPSDDPADRGAGRRTLCLAIRGEPELRSRALAALDDAESAAVLALEPIVGEGDAERASAFVHAALGAGVGPALTVALGAIERGACDPLARGRWERAGREIAAGLERGWRG